MQRTLETIRLVMVVSFLVVFIQAIPLAAEAAPGRGGYYELGVFAYEAEQYQQAESYLRQAWQRNSRDPLVNHYLGKTYLKLKQTRKAALYLDIAHSIQPDAFGLTHDIARLNQLNENYDEALILYEEHLAEYPDDMAAVYNAGICAFSLNRFEKAVELLQRAGKMSPSLTAKAAYYSGISFFRMDRPDLAAEQFRQAAALSDSDNMRTNAANWLAVIEGEKPGTRPYSLYLRLGGQYDDNVRLTTDDLDDWLGIKKDKSDFALIAYLSGRYHLLNRESWKGGIGYSHYQTRYDKMNDYDLTGSIGDLFIEYYRFPFIFGLVYQPSYYWLHTDSYLSRHQIGPRITWQAGADTFATFVFNHKRNRFFSSRDRDGYANQAGLHIDYRLPFENAGLRWAIITETSHADQSYNDYRSLETSLGLTFQIAEKTRLGLNAAFNTRTYGDPDPIFRFTRKDNRYSGTVSLEQAIINDWLGLALDYDISRNDSNNRYYDYTRNCVTLSVTVNL